MPLDDSAELWRQRSLGWQPELPRHRGKDIGAFYDARRRAGAGRRAEIDGAPPGRAPESSGPRRCATASSR